MTHEVAFPDSQTIAHLAKLANEAGLERKPPKRLKLERVKSKPGSGVFGNKGFRHRPL